MRKALLLGLLFTLFTTGIAVAAGYNYVAPDDFKKWLEGGQKMTIVDIQPAAEFREHHFKDSIETNAFPVKTEEERTRLDKAIPQLIKSADAVVVICPRGGKGAKGAYDHLKSKGIDEKRLYILEGGIQAWPHKEMTVPGK